MVWIVVFAILAALAAIAVFAGRYEAHPATTTQRWRIRGAIGALALVVVVLVADWLIGVVS